MLGEVISILSAGIPQLSSLGNPSDDPLRHLENGGGVLSYAVNTQQLSATHRTSTAKHPRLPQPPLTWLTKRP